MEYHKKYSEKKIQIFLYLITFSINKRSEPKYIVSDIIIIKRPSCWIISHFDINIMLYYVEPPRGTCTSEVKFSGKLDKYYGTWPKMYYTHNTV